MIRVKQLVQDLACDQRGNVFVTFAFASGLALAAVGAAVDYGRAFHEKSKMQNALDAAVVSAVAKLKETNNWDAASHHAMAVFSGVYANAIDGGSNAGGGRDQPVVSFSHSGSNQVSGAATMTTSTPFLKLVTGYDLSVGAASNAVPPSGAKLEVALMVDLTGSMGWNAAAGVQAEPCNIVSSPSTKLDFLKCAGEDLLNILLPSSGANDATVKVAVAPFADYVNAGPYAAAVTGLPATGGAYANRTNLASTRQGPFTGTYSGTSTSGSQFGSMGTSAPSGAQSFTAGATYANGYCANPTSTGTVAFVQIDNRNAGFYIPAYNSSAYVNDRWTGDAPAGMVKVPSGEQASAENYYGHSGWRWRDMSYYYYTSATMSAGHYYIPLVQSTSGLTVQNITANNVWVDNSTYATRTGNVGNGIAVPNGVTPPAGAMSAAASPGGGFLDVWYIDTDGSPRYWWNTSGYYMPVYASLTATQTVSGCESAAVSQPSSYLIGCVTESMTGNTLDYSADKIVGNKTVGAYNHGLSAKSNYSSDGKCWVAGRELPAVIPLTNNRATLMDFLEDATPGGATPGHLGTAWASYLLSPDWDNIWPTASVPAAYNSTTVKKAAILMTDGQYNLQYSFGNSTSNISAKQALMICKEMRSKGIKVYTVGFGFAANATPPNPNVEAMSDAERTTALTGGGYSDTQKALDTLAKCASSNASYYFPYDGQSLRDTFKSIANALSADAAGGKARLTN